MEPCESCGTPVQLMHWQDTVAAFAGEDLEIRNARPICVWYESHRETNDRGITLVFQPHTPERCRAARSG